MKLFFDVVIVLALAVAIVVGGVALNQWARRVSPIICHGNCQRACQDLCFNRGYCPYQRGE